MVITPSLRPERLDQIVHECLDGAVPALARQGTTIVRQIDSRIPDYPLDRALFTEAVGAVMSEAIRLVKPERDMRVTVKSNRNALMLAVKAPGPGLDDAGREALFAEGRPPGALARARAIVDAHGGSIWANGIAGRGITWYITLPSRRP